MPADSSRYALISVSDKTGLVDFCRQLKICGFELISTSGTAELLRECHIPVIEVSQITDYPEILSGRVKTLHPSIHGGILHRRDNEEDMKHVEEHAIPAIDMVIANLYPFDQTLKQGVSHEEIIENIDIGGTALLRASAKNFQHVTVICDPNDYNHIIAQLKKNQGTVDDALRKELAYKAFSLTSWYDSVISAYFFADLDSDSLFPERFTPIADKVYDLRYGENNHQKAALYQTPAHKRGIAYANQLQGIQMGYNNYIDADCALSLISEFDNPACCIVKHANPCGVAEAFSVTQAWRRALNCDPQSAFGGIVAFNRMVDIELAEQINQIFLEVLIAPDFSEEAIELFAQKPKLRLLASPPIQNKRHQTFIHSISGGYLIQEEDNQTLNPEDMTIVTKREPSEQELIDLLFAWKVAKYVKSNAIALARDGASVGIGAGQMSRVDAANIAVNKARHFQGVSEAVAASDAFIPFADSVELLGHAGVTAIIQPGSSKRDNEVIEAANQANMAMIFTHMRHFRH